MENQKLTAIIIAVMAAILVMLAGRSCAGNINNSNKQNSSSTGYSISYANTSDIVSEPEGGTVEYEITAASDPNIEYVTDLLGRVISSQAVTQEFDERYTDTQVRTEYVTDLLGRVVGTTEVTEIVNVQPETQTYTEYVTDILGRVIDVIEHDGSLETEDPVQPTSKKNILEEYREQHPELYPTTEAAQPGNEPATAPKEIHITIG